MNLQLACTHILRFWAGTPDQHRENDRLCRRMRIAAVQLVLSRNDGERFVVPGYAYVQRAEWPCCYLDTVLWKFCFQRSIRTFRCIKT